MTDVPARLSAVGMSVREALAKAPLFARSAEALDALTGASGERAAFFVPGRIEVLGKHTDYAGGRSLLCAVERGFAVLVAPRDDARVRVVDALRGETRELAFDPDNVPPLHADWSNYVATVVRRVASNFPQARRGVDIALASDLPAASGMSSSSALVVAIFLALDAVNRLSEDATYRRTITSPETLAAYLGSVENGQSFGALAAEVGVGTFGGSEDHTAILCCRPGMLSSYAFCPVRMEREIVFPSDRVFVVAHSGVAAEKTSRAKMSFNELSLAVQRILALWNEATGRADECLADAVASAPDAADAIRTVLGSAISNDLTSQRLLDRFDQFMAEVYDIIPRATDAFARADFESVGKLVDSSQRAAESLLGNQIPETIALAHLARRYGADASSAFGAGFGGSVWALVAAADADRFVATWRDAYHHAFPAVAAGAVFIVTRPGPGATRL